MTERRPQLPRATIRPLPETWLVAGCLTTLVSLSLADRLVAWLIGAFPSTALLWQIRFEYLRPIAVYYDYVAMLFGVFLLYGFSGYGVYAWRKAKGQRTSVISTSTDEPEERGLHK